MFENCASRVVVGSRTTGVRRVDQMGDDVRRLLLFPSDNSDDVGSEEPCAGPSYRG